MRAESKYLTSSTRKESSGKVEDVPVGNQNDSQDQFAF
jgi:hypothetical protein